MKAHKETKYKRGGERGREREIKASLALRKEEQGFRKYKMHQK